MKNFEYGTPEYWNNEIQKSLTALTLLCKGLIVEVADIARSDVRENEEACDDYSIVRAMCRAVVDADAVYENSLAMHNAVVRKIIEADAQKVGEEDS